jgi:hypothetical protein
MDSFPMTMPRPTGRDEKIVLAANLLLAKEGFGDRLDRVRLYGYWLSSEVHTNGTVRYTLNASIRKRLHNPDTMFVRIDPGDDTQLILSTIRPGTKVYFAPDCARFYANALTQHLADIGCDPRDGKLYFPCTLVGKTRVVVNTEWAYDKAEAIHYEKEHPECRGPRSTVRRRAS